MINLLTSESLAEVVAAQKPPCLSLYQPTHRHHPDNQQDVIRFGNLALSHPRVDDLLDDLGEFVEKKGGKVRVIPAGQMPTRAGVAAIYRY